MKPAEAAPAQDAAALLAQAHAHHHAGRLAEAEPLYRALLRVAPGHALALDLLGVLCHRSSRVAEGLALIERAIAADPQRAAAHCNRGAALRDLGRFDEALASTDTALRLDPLHAIAANNRAALLLDLDRADEALTACEQVLAWRPGDLAALFHRARSLQRLRRIDAALAACATACAAQPDFVPALDLQVELLRGAARWHQALPLCERLCAIDPASAARWHQLGSVLLELGRPRDALASLERALALAPDDAASLHDSGHAWIALGRPDLALAPYARALALQPRLPFLRGQWLHTRLKVADWDGLAEQTALLAQEIDAGLAATAPFPATLLDLTESRQLRAARIYAEHRHPDPAPPLPPWPREPRIRIGYFSPDLRQHPLSVLCAGLFECHDRARFEVTAFSYGAAHPGDAMRERLRAGFERWLDLDEASDADIVATARALHIDIAVDLAGPTQGARDGLFARRVAPVQVAMIGLPGSSGAPWIDHLIADARVVPEASRMHFREHVVALPNCYLANDSRREPAGPAPTRASVGLPEHGFVFCSFNQNAKITPAVFALWMRLLREVDGSVLWLLQDNPLATHNLRATAQREGVDPQRLVFAPRISLADHLARHGCADLFLDTLPYNAHTGACDALWAGLPVLTRVGETFAGRVGASVEHAAGLQELVVHSAAECISLALDLARNPTRLAALKARLVAERDHCALFDTARYTRDLEAAFTVMLA